MIPQFLGSGMFPTEDVPKGVDDVIDSEEDVQIVDEAGSDEDDDEDDDEADDDIDEADDDEAQESEERDAHAGVNRAFANLANFDFDGDFSDGEPPVDLEEDRFEQVFQDQTGGNVPLVPDFDDSRDIPSLVNNISGVTEAIKLALITDLKEQAKAEEEAKEEAESGDEAEADADEESESDDDTPSYLIRCKDSDCELDE